MHLLTFASRARRAALAAAVFAAALVPSVALAAPGDADDDLVPDDVDTVATTGTIVSTGKTAYQSSTSSSLNAAARAVDGNRAGEWSQGPLASTSDTGPWWEVDLGRIHTIDSINIYPRTDCCTERLDGATVIISAHAVGDVSVDDAARNAVWSTTISSPGDLVQLAVPDRIGRYVRIQLPATGSPYLQLAEVDVMGVVGRPNDVDGDYIINSEDTINADGNIVSTAMAATQSSVWTGRPDARPESAVDDIRDGGRDGNQPIAITDDDEPWWQVDLGTWYEVTGVNLYNRTDGSQDLIDGAIVMLASQPFTDDMTLAEAQTHAAWSTSVAAPANVIQLSVPEPVGRYLRVQLPSGTSRHLGLAEVDVIGHSAQLPVTTWPYVAPAATQEGNTLTWNGNPGSWQGFGHSDRFSTYGLTAGTDFSLAFAANHTPSAEFVMMGLGNVESNDIYTDIDYAIYLRYGILWIYESGASRGTYGTYADGDEFSIEVIGTTLSYRHNGTTIRTVSVAAGVDWYVDTAAGGTVPAQLTDIAVHPIGSPAAENTGPDLTDGLAVTGWPFVAPDAAVEDNRLTWTGNPTGWQEFAHSDPFSTIGLTPGSDFTLAFNADHAPGSDVAMIGLGQAETAANYRDVDYAIYLRYGLVWIYESGSNRGTFQPYTSGDQFTLEVVGTTLTYRHNDTILRTVTVPAGVDWYVDTAVAGMAEINVNNITVHPA